MRRDELLINGERVDIGSASISLEYVNNMLTEIDKISASRSYTVNLPRTARNDRIFDGVSLPSHQSTAIGVYLDAEYRRRGISILRNAKAYVTAITPDSIDICLIWEGLARVSTWVAEGKSIKELNYSNYVWNRFPSVASAQGEVLQATYNTGVAYFTLPPPPSVSVWHLFKKIMDGIGQPWDDEGMDYQTNPSEKYLLLRDLFIPLCSRSGSRSEVSGAVFSSVEPIYTGSLITLNLKGRTYGTLPESASGTISMERFSSVVVSGNVRMYHNGWSTGVTLNIYGYTGGTRSTNPVFSKECELDTGRRWASVSFEAEIDGSDYDSLRFVVVSTGGADDYYGEGEVRVVPVLKQAEVGGAYDVASNLPDIKQVDIIKAICAIGGYSIVNDGKGVLNFVKVDSLIEKIRNGNTEDFSDKVVNFRGVPERTERKVEGYAQRNWFRYKADDENEGVDADACMNVEDKTLEKEKTVITLPFAATRGSTIKHYEETDGAVTDVKVEPRIMARSYVGTSLALEFSNSLFFSSILNERYGGLRRMLENPTTLTLYARLNERDLSVLDWTRPVYLKQTGQYYVLSKVMTDNESDVCEITLIQL